MRTLTAIDEFIAGRGWSHEEPAHHQYILTIFGLYARPSGKAISIAAVVRLLAELDVESASVRSAISRLKKKGVLVSRKMGGSNGYALLDDLEPHMQAGDERIFSPHSASIGDPWLLVSFSVPESERQQRYKIRTGLDRMGFGTVAAGLYIGPARLQSDVVEYIREHQLWDYVELFIVEPSGFSDIKSKVARWWDLDGLAAKYREFINIYQPEVAIWQSFMRDGGGTPREAFRTYIPLLTQWRRLPFLDPGLPLELLPESWAGVTAGKIFNDLHRMLKSLSARHFMSLESE
ncbi:transcriptional regulator [Alcaligenes faecalis]|uniref:PaaX family transcriptional regulator n=1 Tax=Alcaligenes faecalis TaxID=511 RepID=UPI000A2DE58F|nr:PaaX family transcriptional regulator C-terminal domain-containing protein [Alcaligenes faecalis]OSZ45878.1 transcriptional regulator [Alcaligenes faecalis]OSZ52798.1 transcriptional regulator [Alcaligenes faecalis]OSZ54839.1 transcriptional regulator [Alcaligenes faecalis]